MTLRILIAGSGAREHALAWRLASRPGVELFCIPGNPGIARLAHCLPVTELTPIAILDAARSLKIDLAVIGPEAPLVSGVVDLFRHHRLPIVGPTAEAARLEGSKVYAKRFFADHQIPTARFQTADSLPEALAALSQFPFPVVIKADGLAAGKGVIIANNREDAEQACSLLGPNLLIEEFLEGREVSFIVLSDGRTVQPLLPSRDHKRALDGDRGPNTGGMGAFCDPSLLTDIETAQVLENIIWPTVQATGFTGFLYAGLMITAEGPKLLEYNVRLGDPEAQALMHHWNDDLAEILLAAAHGKLPNRPFVWHPGVSHAVVLAASGYPGSFRTGDAITGLADAENRGAAIFHAGTRVGWSGYATAGGRVLTVTTKAPTLSEAAQNTYDCVARIHFPGMQYRTDIGRPADSVS